MSGYAQISTDVLCRYAADAAREVRGVHAVVDSHLPGRRGVRVDTEDGRVRVELRLVLEWGVAMPDVARAVQAHVAGYLQRMADIEPDAVDVVVDDVAGA